MDFLSNLRRRLFHYVWVVLVLDAAVWIPRVLKWIGMEWLGNAVVSVLESLKVDAVWKLMLGHPVLSMLAATCLFVMGCAAFAAKDSRTRANAHNIPDIEDNPDENALNLWITNNFSEEELARSALWLHGRRPVGYQPEPLPNFQTMRLRANATGLPKGVKRRFQILEFKNPSWPIFVGIVNGEEISVALPFKGAWRVDLEIRWAGGNHRFVKCFRWGDAAAPHFIACQKT